MKIIKQRQRLESVEYNRHFEYEDDPGAGFGFPCDEYGNVKELEHEAGRKSLAACLAGSIEVARGTAGHKITVKLLDMGVQEYSHSYVEPAVGECACGAHVDLDRFTNTCHGCGRDYNSAGQLLAPRSQWGEETGETAADILAIDGMGTDRCFDE